MEADKDPDIPTEKQLKCIKVIFRNTGVRFEGETKEEATAYISENIERSKKVSAHNKMVFLGRAYSIPSDSSMYRDYGHYWGNNE